MPTLLELQTKRNTLVTQGRAIHDKATTEKREMTAEEITNFDKYMADSDEVKAQIEAIAKAEARTKRLNDATKELETRAGRATDPENPDPDAAAKEGVFKFPKRNAHGMGGSSTREIKLDGKNKLNSPEMRAAFQRFVVGKSRSEESEL